MASRIPEPGAVDQAFASFVRTGNPGDLAKVFDETAPELLRLASHLVSDLGLAEDLVQQTFLVAIESRREFSHKGPVLHWLTGILTHRARQARRRVDRQPDPGRLPSNRVQEPPQEAAAIELTEAVSNAIAGLPEPYRPVLLMHIKLGHPVGEIALVLGRAPGTVRKQLSRGMEMLRKALPAGFAATISSTVLPGQGLAGMKEIVVRAAELAAPATMATVPPAAIGGIILMKKMALTISVLALASLAYLAWPDPPASDLEPPSPGTAGAMQSNASGEARGGAPSMEVDAQGRTQLERARIAGSRTLAVQVLDSLGRPAVGVPMGILPRPENDRSPASPLGLTQPPEGILRWSTLPLDELGPADGYLLRPLIPGFTGGGISLEQELLEDPPAEPLVLRLPPTGRVLVYLTNIRGEPRRDLDAAVTLSIPHPLDGFGRINAGPHEQWTRTSSGEAAYAFDRVVAGRDYIASSVGAFASRRNERFAGPRQQDDEVEVFLRSPREYFELVGRALDEQRQPLRDSRLRFNFAWTPGINTGVRNVGTDEGGYFRVPIEGGGTQRTLTELLIERIPEIGEVDPPGQVWTLAGERPLVSGDNNLGDVVLETESRNIVAAGTILVNGRPLRERLEFAVVAETDMGFPRRLTLTTRYLDEGRFEISGRAEPGNYFLYLADPDAERFLPFDPIGFQSGREDLHLDLETGGSLVAELLVDLDERDADNLEAVLVTEEGAVPEPVLPEFLRRSFSPPFGLTELLRARVPPPVGSRSVVSWSRLWPGRYDFEIRSRGAREPLVTVPDVEIASGRNRDPRLSGIDLRGKLRVITLTLQDTDAAPIWQRDTGAVMVLIQDRADGAALQGFGPDHQGRVRIPTPEPYLDVIAVARGFQTRELTVTADQTIVLERAPEVRLRLPELPVPLPEGTSLHVALRPEGTGTDRRRYDYRGDGGGRSTGLLGPKLEAASGAVQIEEGQELRIEVSGEGAYVPELRLRNRATGRSVRIASTQPEQLTPARSSEAQVVDLHVPTRALEEAIRQAGRDR